MGYLVPPAKDIPGKLDRESKVSVHIQLRELLRDFIQRQSVVGRQLPSERDMASHFGVARMTLRHAVEALVEEELLERVVGVGTFVVKAKVDLSLKLTSYSEEMTRRGLRPSAQTLAFEQIPATVRLARELQLEEGQGVVRVPGLLDAGPPTSLYQVLRERYGLVIEWGEDTIEANAATPSIARLLKVDVGAPVLRTERHAFVSRSTVDYSVSFYRADRYKLRVPLLRPGVRPRRAY